MPTIHEVVVVLSRGTFVLGGAALVWFRWGRSKEGLEALGVRQALGFTKLSKGKRYAIEVGASLVLCTVVGMAVARPSSFADAITAGMSSTAFLSKPGRSKE